MTDINCENIRVAAMAIADDEECPLTKNEIETHLYSCERCRTEIEDLHATINLFSSHTRLRSKVDVWPEVNQRIQSASEGAPSFAWRVLLLFGIPLFGYKIFLLTLQTAPSLWFSLVPLILVIVVFSFLKANPFKINCELTLEGETTL
jgi:predicted anti-sigma-YlaC factor YlaD